MHSYKCVARLPTKECIPENGMCGSCLTVAKGTGNGMRLLHKRKLGLPKRQGRRVAMELNRNSIGYSNNSSTVGVPTYAITHQTNLQTDPYTTNMYM